jgi:transglutaminase-like putative cysteine protease
MFYAVRHVTRYRYSRPVWQSLMEIRMHPLTEHSQRCFTFQLSVNPRARIFGYVDYLGNQVHHFDLPMHHRELTIVADSLVNIDAPDPLPPSLGAESWEVLGRILETDDYWPMLSSSHYVKPCPQLDALMQELRVDAPHGRDPLTLLHDVTAGINGAFDYVKKSTAVNSPIEVSLQSRKGVCQDFSHIMIGVVRELGIPCRYVSGYLYHSDRHKDRSADGATHAWVEALLPGLGWVGFDPTNGVATGTRHIKTAIGRDYADVPPTRGTMNGRAETELQVAVRVAESQSLLPPDDVPAADEEWARFFETDEQALVYEQELQQKQQQQ